MRRCFRPESVQPVPVACRGRSSGKNCPQTCCGCFVLTEKEKAILRKCRVMRGQLEQTGLELDKAKAALTIGERSQNRAGAGISRAAMRPHGLDDRLIRRDAVQARFDRQEEAWKRYRKAVERIVAGLTRMQAANREYLLRYYGDCGHPNRCAEEVGISRDAAARLRKLVGDDW